MTSVLYHDAAESHGQTGVCKQILGFLKIVVLKLSRDCDPRLGRCQVCSDLKLDRSDKLV